MVRSGGWALTGDSICLERELAISGVRFPQLLKDSSGVDRGRASNPGFSGGSGISFVGNAAVFLDREIRKGYIPSDGNWSWWLAQTLFFDWLVSAVLQTKGLKSCG